MIAILALTQAGGAPPFPAAAPERLSAFWKQLTRETNSHAASTRGEQQYATGRFEEAARSYRTASGIAPNPRSAFNLGTSQIAAGRRTEGSATITSAMSDPSLRSGALYNRGNSALASKAFEHAIRDYSEALRLAPGDRDAKRNLEIAQHRLDEEQRQRRQQRRQGGGSPQPQQPPQPNPGDEQEQKQGGEADAEALLRSVQQQEQEELARMKRARGESRAVGW
ncbi:MAG TPA: tetratricopeptide repeat protein [Thermoanaerobaculia bacterium]|nr:tetratricopeptide repeat protein [Thermoanaerobaculia bacterium]